MNEEQIITAAMQFLQRAQLQGGEVPAFVAVSNWLTQKHTEAVALKSAPPLEEPTGD